MNDHNFADVELLQCSRRAAFIAGEDLEDLLITSSRLSRALWGLLCNPDFNSSDRRTIEGAEELARVVADYTSAARYAFHRSLTESPVAICDEAKEAS